MILGSRLSAYILSGVMAFGLLPPLCGHAESTRMTFWCESAGSPARTKVRFPSGLEKTFLIWSSDVAGVSPSQQCEEASLRFTRKQIGNNFRYMVAGKYNERNVICADTVPSSEIIECESNNVLIYLNDDDDIETFLGRLYKALKPTGDPANHNSAYGRNGYGIWLDAYLLLANTY
jgi:Circadian oscillating protein COP23